MSADEGSLRSPSKLGGGEKTMEPFLKGKGGRWAWVSGGKSLMSASRSA